MKKILRILLSSFIIAALMLPLIPATPTYAATVDEQVGAGTDDCRVAWTGAAWALSMTDVTTVGYYSASFQKMGSGMRFQTVAVPQGATIIEAHLTLIGSAGALTIVNSRITGEDVDDAAAFSDIADYQARRGTVVGGANNNFITTAQVTWDDIGEWIADVENDSPDIKTIIQEIVNRVGWNSGNDMVIFWDDHEARGTQTDSVSRRAFSYDGTPAKAAQLHIVYASAPTVTTQAVTDITDTTATGNGNITETYEDASAWGVVYNTTGNPTTADDVAAGTGSGGTGAFTASMTSLTPGVHYYVKAYATNTEGTGYGSQVEFTAYAPGVIDRQVSAFNDNIRVAYNGISWNYSFTDAINTGYYSSSYYKMGAGLRFNNITIPQGTTILEAHLTFVGGQDRSNTVVNTKLSGEDSDDAAAFSDYANYDARSRTTAVVEWADLPAWTWVNLYDSPDIKNIIQEIVDRGGWSSGNDMVIFWDDHDDLSTHTNLTCRRSWSYSQDSSKAVRLHIESETTPVDTPVVTTEAATSVAQSSAILNANVIDIGAAAVDIRGFDYNGDEYTDFTIVVIPDTQLYSQDYPNIFTEQTTWIKDNKVALNIKFVLHVGDIVNVGTTVSQWIAADASMDILDGQVPYLVVPGNHDYENAAARTLTNYNTYFGPARFSGYEWFGGNYPVGSMANSYGTFSYEGIDYLVMGLEFSPTDNAIAWAKGVLDANLDKFVIIFTHLYMYWDNTRQEDPGDDFGPDDYGMSGDSHDGEELWNDLIKLYPNILMVTSGHELGDGVGKRTDYVSSQPINQVLQNYQMLDYGGNGWLRYYTFKLNDNQIHATTYSPHTLEYNTDQQHTFTWTLRHDYSDYGTWFNSITESGNFGEDPFDRTLVGLASNQLYHFRAKAHNTSGWGYGTVRTFTTSFHDVPSITTDSVAELISTAVTLQGTLTDLGDYSPVYTSFEYGLTVSYGAVGSPSTEETTTSTGGFNVYIGGLEPGTTYHYVARVRYDGTYVYGVDKTFITPTAGEPGIDPPDILRIDDVKVFSNYFEPNDQLYVIAYRIIYNSGTPILDVTDYFDFQLLDGTTLKAQVPVIMWDYRPGSIYLRASSAPAWGGSYRIKIIGTPEKWETPPEAYRDLTPGDWQGVDLTQLDTWVISLADSFQSYYDLEYVIRSGAQTYLSSEGGARFNMGIPGLNTQRPNLFSPTWTGIPVPEREDPEIVVIDTEARTGGYIFGLFETTADFFSMDTNAFGALVFGGGYIILAIVIGVMISNGLVGMGLASPILLAGAWFGLIPMAVIAIIAGIFVTYVVYTIWMRVA